LPSPEQVHELRRTAIEHGVRVFNTARAYGDSERLTGEFFRRLLSPVRRRLRLATKCCEHWIEDSRTTSVDHSYDLLVRSIDRSLERLGAIDVLQVHKNSVDA
jgi:aryl-alcohol dehydrogenase-like predicted oxidoreductase